MFKVYFLDLDKRTPYFFPMRPYSNQHQADELEDEEDNGESYIILNQNITMK